LIGNWETDKNKATLNEWHICYNALSGRKFSAMYTSIGWIVDPYCRKDGDEFFVRVTHFAHYPASPI